jgi:hypothetical protein
MRYEDEHFTGTRSIVALSEIARIGAKASVVATKWEDKVLLAAGTFNHKSGVNVPVEFLTTPDEATEFSGRRHVLPRDERSRRPRWSGSGVPRAAGCVRGALFQALERRCEGQTQAPRTTRNPSAPRAG